MAIGDVSIQTAGGANTLGVIPASGYGFSFLNPLYRYANLTLPYSPNDPGLTFIYDNSTLAPVVLLYARFFNLLNEASVPTVANVGTSAFTVSGAFPISASNCLDVRSFGAVGDGVADDTAAIQAALNQAYQNYLGNQKSAGQTSAVAPQMIQSIVAHVENGTGTQLNMSFLIPVTAGNKVILGLELFDYSGGNAPTITDSKGNTYTSFGSIVNGQHVLSLWWANMSTSGLLTITITVTGLHFNSFMAAIAAEMSGTTATMTIDGFSSSTITPGNAFVPAVLGPTGNNDLIVSLVYNDAAAGVVPNVPAGYLPMGSTLTPQPNGLNGSIPSTSMAFSESNGNTNVTPQWSTSSRWSGNALIVAIRLTPIAASTTKGFTTVCIPNGVQCMVSPIGLDERNLPTPTCRYGPAAYSLVINDGVTLSIDGALIANRAATASMVSPDHSGDFGWFLVVNAAWLQNASIMQVNPVPAVDQVASGGQGLTSSTSVSWTLTPRAANEYMLACISTNGVNSVSPGGSAIASSPILWQAAVPGQTLFTATYGSGVGSAFVAASFSVVGSLSLVQTASSNFSGQGNKTISFGAPVSAADIIFVAIAIEGASSFQAFTVTDDKGNVYTQMGTSNIVASSGGVPNLQASLWACQNPASGPKTITVNIAGQGPATVTISIVDIANFVNLCGKAISWLNYLAGTAFNEGPRNKSIKITGNGQIFLNGDFQLNNATNPNGQLFPVSLARFVCADTSSIDSLEIINPFGCAIQWLNSTNVTVASLFIHDGTNSAAANTTKAVQDPGIIEMDMLRNSFVQNNIIQVCPQSRGILDWAGYQNSIFGNTLNSDYTGYEFRDCAGETGYFFNVGPVTHNSEISQNKATNMLTVAASPGPFGSEAGSNGFLFYAGFIPQATRSSSTGTSFHDNIGNNNSTDFSYTTFVSFRSLVNNTFSSSSGSGSSGGGTVTNSQISVTGETPAGTIDGTNTVFTLAHIPITATMTVYLNGLFEVFGTDYTVSGKQITFAVAPNPGSILSVSYQYLSGN